MKSIFVLLTVAATSLTGCATRQPATPAPQPREPSQVAEVAPPNAFETCLYHAALFHVKTEKALRTCDSESPVKVYQAGGNPEGFKLAAYYTCIFKAIGRGLSHAEAEADCAHLRPSWVKTSSERGA